MNSRQTQTSSRGSSPCSSSTKSSCTPQTQNLPASIILSPSTQPNCTARHLPPIGHPNRLVRISQCASLNCACSER